MWCDMVHCRDSDSDVILFQVQNIFRSNPLLLSLFLSAVCPPSCKHRACTKDNHCCHDQCLGGCVEPSSPSKCVACRNFLHQGVCVDKCPLGFYTFKGWRCVDLAFCQALHNKCKQGNDGKGSECHEYVIHQGACIPECPSGYTTINSTT